MHSIYLYLFITFQIFLVEVACQRGDFIAYGTAHGDIEIDGSSTNFVSSSSVSGTSGAATADAPKSVQWNLPERIKIFQQDVGLFRIFESGVITFGGTVPECGNADPNFSETYLAPYWISADLSMGGKIFYRMERTSDSNSISGQVNNQELVDELNTARAGLSGTDGAAISVSDIISVTIITWEKMMPPSGDLVNPGNKLSFQLIIIATATRSYSITVYKRLDYHALHYLDSSCSQQAIAGIHYADATNGYHFELSNFFYITASKLLYHTNIQAYTTLGRYCLILEAVLIQPIPPQLNCNVPPTQQDPYCYLGVSPNFCEEKAVGIYKHPTFCDRFLSCGFNGLITQVHRCPLWTGFNEYFRTCDWSGFLICLNIQRGAIGQSIALLQSSINSRSSLGSIELKGYDTLLFAVHNNTCVGKADSTNIIDITSCEHFISCTNTRSVRQKCPYNLYYNVEKDQCDYKFNVNCTNGVRPNGTSTAAPPRTTKSTTTIPTTTTQPANNQTTKPPLTMTTPPISNNVCRAVSGNGNVPDPGSCSRYIVCKDGKVLHKMPCPRGTVFSTVTKGCDFPFNVDCLEGVRPQSSQIPPATMPITTGRTPRRFNVYEICAQSTDGKVADQDSCENFFICRNSGVFDYERCPDGLFFSSQKRDCVPQQMSDCPDGTPFTVPGQ